MLHGRDRLAYRPVHTTRPTLAFLKVFSGIFFIIICIKMAYFFH